MGSITFNVSTLSVASYGVTTGVTLTYNNTVPASAQIGYIGDFGTAEWTDSSKTAITITTNVNDTDSYAGGYLQVSAYDISTQSTGTWSVQIQILPRSGNFILTPQRLDFTATGGTMYIDCSYHSSITFSSIQIQNKPSVGSMEFTDSTKARIAVTLPQNTTESTLSWQPNLWAMSTGGSQRTLRIPITQAPAQEGSLSISPTGNTVHWIGSTTYTTVTMSHIVGDLSVVSSEAWAIPVWDPDTSKVGIQYWTNTTTNQRSAVITVSGVDELGVTRSQQFVLVQIGKPQPGKMEINPGEITVGQSGSTGSTQITYTNIDVNTIDVSTTDDDWLSIDFDEYGGLMTITVTESNPSNWERDGYITVTAQETVYLETVSVRLHIIQQPNAEAGTILTFTDGNSINIPTNGKVWTAHISYTNIDPETIGFASLPSWLSATFTDTGKTEVTFVVGANTTQEPRTKNLVLTGLSVNQGILYADDYSVYQSFEAATVEFPIWKDYDIFISPFDETSNSIYFRFKKGNDVLYTGNTYRPNLDEDFRVRANRILKHYIKSDIDLTTGGMKKQDDAYISFSFEVANGDPDNEESWIIYKYVNVYNDWDYVDINEVILTKPIYNYVDNRQKFIMTLMNHIGDNPLNININGTTYVVSDEIKNYVQDKPQSNIVVSGTTYEVKRTDFPYCLYYKQKNGGYSWMFFNRASKQTDKISQNNYRKEGDNKTIGHSMVTYLNEIDEKWTLKSNFLNDRQSKLYTEIPATTQCWLHLLEEDRIVPVVITTSSVEYLHWANNSKKKIRFNLEVQNSQEKFER